MENLAFQLNTPNIQLPQTQGNQDNLVDAAGEKKNELIRTKKRVLQKFPRLSQVLKRTRIVDDACSAHGGIGYTDGSEIHINTASSRTDIDDVMAHEAMHIEMGHCNKSVESPEDWNIAADAVINEELRDNGFAVRGGIDIPSAKSMGEEKLYRCLLNARRERQIENTDGGRTA